MTRPVDWIITMGLVGVAVVLSIAALTVSVRSGLTTSSEFPLQQRVNKPLFPEFTDPSAPTSLTVVDYDGDLNQTERFEVANRGGRWVIPSQKDYPADADEQLSRAANALIDLTVLEAIPINDEGASSDAGGHATYGVVAPTDEELDEQKMGVGRMVTFTGDNGQTLASLIIGKAASPSDDPSQPASAQANLHFVRVAGQDPVYVVAIDPTLFEPTFSRWINRDLLAINPFDVDELAFENYSLSASMQNNRPTVRVSPGASIVIERDEEAGAWTLASMTVPVPGAEAVDETLRPDQQLNTEVLDAARDALKSVTIVDVARKPEGLGANLQVGESIEPTLETQLSLQQRGFYIAGRTADRELLAANGETLATLKNGVSYVLRFGETADLDIDGETPGVKRYLMVTARVDESRFPPPQPPTMPGESPAGNDGEDTSSDAEPTPEDVDAAEERLLREAEQRAERERLQAEFDKQLTEWRERRQRAEAAARAANARFADWYYVIDDAMYQKLHLTRDKLIMAKPAEQATGDAAPPAASPARMPELTIEPEPTLPPADLPPLERFRLMEQLPVGEPE